MQGKEGVVSSRKFFSVALSADVDSVNESKKVISSSSNHLTKKPKSPFFGFGILCAVFAGLVYAFNTLLVKMIETSGALQMSASRCVLQSLILLPYATYMSKRGSLDIIGSRGMLKFLIIRATTGSIGSILLYQSIRRIPVGDAVTLLFTSTIFAALLAFFFLKEPLQILDAIMIGLTLCGVVMISKPTLLFGGSFQGGTSAGGVIAGVAFGLASGFLNGCTMVVLRKLGKQKTDPSLNILYYSFLGSVITTIMVVVTDSFQLPCLNEVPYISLLAITGIGGQILLTLGLQHERAAVIPAVRSLQIVFVYILQVSFN